MNDDSRSRRRWCRAWPPMGGTVDAIIATAILALVAAGCSSDSQPSTGSGGSSPAGESLSYQKALAYVQCMRSRGVPTYPDPTSKDGTIVFPRGTLKVSQSQLQAAQNACQHLLPAGQASEPGQHQQMIDELKFAQCMRSRGAPNWPDPTDMGGGEYEFNLRAANIDPSSPQDLAAEQRCESQLRLSGSQLHLPGGKPAAGGAKAGGGS